MAATTRWVEYSTTAAGSASTGGAGQLGLGTRGFCLATASVLDTFTIGANNNKLYIDFDGDTSSNITLTSGTLLDPRFIAKDITESIQALGKIGGFAAAQCVWENNAFKLYSGTLGSSSAATIASGTDTAHITLGWGTKTETGGSATGNTSDHGITISGTYSGFFDEVYRIVIGTTDGIGTPSLGGSNTYTGTITAGGVFTHSASITYTMSISTTNGTTMGGGTGNVPTMSWTSTSSLDDGGPVELLYPDFWYDLGTKGVRVKFTDAVFNTVDPAWTIACTYIQYAQGSNPQAAPGTAQYVWYSTRGDDSGSTAVTTAVSGTSWDQIGSRNLYVSFGGGSTNLAARDEFYVICTPPRPSSYSISNLNFGNVTVSTESSVKAVNFEAVSGAIELSTVKFGLQSHGTFSHHDQGNSDTYFRFGTVGPGNNAGTGDHTGLEWRASVTSADIDSDTPPSYLYATKADLAVVSDADSSESIGYSTYAGMAADPMWLNIKLGASEVGANSSINYRLFFDYS
jgi:hypothetical protein